MSNDESDRDAIVARRALLVTSALTALGCSSPGSNNGHASVDTVAVETVNVPPPGSGTATTAPTVIVPDPSRPTWAAVTANAPSFDVPPAGSGVSEAERQELERQFKAMRETYDALGSAWTKGPPTCTPDACEEEWAKAAKSIGTIIEGLRGPLCGWGDRQPISVIERQEAHQAFLRAQGEALQAELAKAAEKVGQKSAWDRARLGGIVPHPCLSCVQPAPRVFERIAFNDDDTVIDTAAQSGLERVKQVLTADPKMRLQIRGHADAAEKGDKKALAKKRAEAVRDWLTKAGVAANRFEIVVLADVLPITSSKGPDRERNRRVDFEKAK